MVGFEASTKFSAFSCIEATFLEFYAIDLDAEDERWGNAVMDCASDLKNDPGSILEATAVLICTLIGRWRKELGNQVATNQSASD